MGFGSELQGQPSHVAILQLQDTELRLLESVKKCVSQRIKCDRDYAAALANMVSTAQKLEASPDFVSPVNQAWSTVIKETENVIKLIRDNADKLCAHTLERLVQVINEKKAARKFYSDEHSRLESEFNKVEELMHKHHGEYEKMVGKVAQDRSKYEDIFRKAKGGSKLEDSRVKYTKSEAKLQRVHNDYVVSLQETTLQQRHYMRSTLPCLLDFQQASQQALVQQCKDILLEYSQFTDHSTEDFQKCHQSIGKSIQNIKPVGEYDEFLNKYRSDPLQMNKFEFDKNLLEDYKGVLLVEEVSLNDLTVEAMQQSRSVQQDQWSINQRRLENKQQELQELEDQLARLPTDDNTMDEATTNSYNVKTRAAEILKREITELQCNVEKYQALHALLDAPFESLGEKEPPPGLELPDASNPVSPTKEDGEYDATAIADSSGFAKKLSDFKSTLSKRNLFKRPAMNSNSTAVPVAPPKDFPNASHGGELNNDKSGNDTVTNPREHKVNGQKDELSPSVDGYQQYNFGEEKHFEMSPQPGRHLDQEEWFHGVLPREEVQKLLQDDGDYLVRASKNRRTGEMQYVLSVMWNGHKHFIIQGTEGSWRFEGDSFPTIQELIIAQHHSNTHVTKKSEAIIKKPIFRPDWVVKNDDIELGQKIGNGNFGDVFRGKYKPRGLEVAVKTCREALSEDLKKKFLQEGQILKQYDHPNIVRFIGIAAQRQPVMIVMEYVPGGSLLNFLKKKGAQQQKKTLIKMCEDAAAGMAYLESKSCIHRDLAARNCLVDEKNSVTKISDFGMSREDTEYTVSGGLKQIPIKWTAPEALNYGTYTCACDVWSFGILMWEVFAFGIIPYPGLTNTQARERVDEGYRMPPPDGCPQSVYDLMLQCWESEPKSRPHFMDLHTNLNNIRTSSAR